VEKWNGREKEKKNVTVPTSISVRRRRRHRRRRRRRRKRGVFRGLTVVTMPVPRELVGVEGDDEIEK